MLRRIVSVALPLVTFGVLMVTLTRPETRPGHGVVPDVVRWTRCDATQALEARGLRWLLSGEREPRAVAEHRGCADDHVTSQAPPPGMRLGAGGIVVLTTECFDTRRRCD